MSRLRGKSLWILSIVLILTVVMTPVPVKTQDYETRIHIRESPPGEYIPGVSVGGWVWVTVDIESPYEWDNTEDGIVAWAFNVHVDPDVLTVWSAHGATFDYFLYDFIDWNMHAGHEPKLLVGEVNKTTGDLINICETIMGHETLGVGAGGNSTDPSWYGAANGLCRLRFRSKSETAHTVIDISDAYYYRTNASAPLGWDKFPFDVVDDGHYNEPPAGVHDVAVTNITPITDLYKAEVYPGWSVDVNVTVENEGDFAETFDVTLYYGATSIGTETVTGLEPAGVMNLTFSWDTTGLTPSNKTETRGEAAVVPDETDTDDNSLGIVVKVKLFGDVDGSGKVDFRDLFDLAAAYGSIPEDSNWNQQCDFDQSSKVDFTDLFDLAGNYGTTYDCP